MQCQQFLFEVFRIGKIEGADNRALGGIEQDQSRIDAVQARSRHEPDVLLHFSYSIEARLLPRSKSSWATRGWDCSLKSARRSADNGTEVGRATLRGLRCSPRTRNS